MGNQGRKQNERLKEQAHVKVHGGRGGEAGKMEEEEGREEPPVPTRGKKCASLMSKSLLRNGGPRVLGCRDVR